MSLTSIIIALSALAKDFNIEDYLNQREFSSLYKIVLDIVKIDLKTQLTLFIAKIDVTHHQNCIALLWATIWDDVSTLYIFLRLDANHRSIFKENTSLHYAIQAHISDNIQVFLNYDVDVNAQNAWNVISLYYVVANRNSIVYVLSLLNFKVNIKVCDQFDKSSFVRAVNMNRSSIVKCLLKYETMLKKSDLWESKSLMTVIEKGFFALTRILIKWSNIYFSMSSIESVLEVVEQASDPRVIRALQVIKSRLIE